MNTLMGLLHAIGIETNHLARTTRIKKICHNSKECIQDSVFFAFPGLHTRGDHYIDEAIANGAVCIVSTLAVEHKREHVLYLLTDTPRPLFSRMCAAFWGWPSSALEVIGITGTDGKSTTADYLYQLLRSQGYHVGLLSTVSIDDGEGKRPSPYRQSTPEADQVQAFLYKCKKHKLTHVILECTSHGLSSEYDRLATIEFSHALVTTISSEHLEFHKSVEAYVEAKCNLVRALQHGGIFLTTKQNPYRTLFLDSLPPSTSSYLLEKTLPFSLSSDAKAAIVITLNKREVSTPLALPCLASNAMLALLCCSLIVKESAESLMPLLANLTEVEGRMISIENNLALRIIIDFAHTASAYEQLFSYIAKTAQGGAIIALFGSGGERDRTKRPLMGKIAAQYASTLILTEEDPRGEPHDQIVADITSQIENSPSVVEQIDDRLLAIQRAIAIAQPGDTVLFLGKGHETTIEGKNGKRPWNEEHTVRKLLARQEGKLL